MQGLRGKMSRRFGVAGPYLVQARTADVRAMTGVACFQSTRMMRGLTMAWRSPGGVQVELAANGGGGGGSDGEGGGSKGGGQGVEGKGMVKMGKGCDEGRAGKGG
eukprot:752538-Hanusia_phi.AAC.1